MPCRISQTGDCVLQGGVDCGAIAPLMNNFVQQRKCLYGEAGKWAPRYQGRNSLFRLPLACLLYTSPSPRDS